MTTIDLKLAETVLRAKILAAIQEQKKARTAHANLVARALRFGHGTIKRADLLHQADQFHRQRIVRRYDIRAMMLALAYARGLPYKRQEKKCAYLGKAPYHFYRRVTNMLARTQGEEMTDDDWNTLRDDVASWMKGNPTMAVRAARDKAEAAIVPGTAFEEK